MCTYLLCVRKARVNLDVVVFFWLFFLNGSLGFLRYNQNSIIELIVNVCRDCVISTDNVL